jgi:hypothetical protein
MRERGEALANRYRVEFIDTTGDTVMPDKPEPERRKQEETTTDGTSLSAIRHRAQRRGLVFSKSRKDGSLYRLAMAGVYPPGRELRRHVGRGPGVLSGGRGSGEASCSVATSGDNI